MIKVKGHEITGMKVKGRTIVAAYYNGHLVFSLPSQQSEDSVIANGVWDDTDLWDNTDLWSNSSSYSNN